jgi:hypothetical protein
MKSFLSLALPNTLVWFSADDISAGSRWSLQITNELAATDFGVILVTRDSLSSEWLAFEAGALGKLVNESRVCPYLVDIEISELKGPLAQFQAKRSDETGTRALVESINRLNPDDALTEAQVRGYFDAFWPAFENQLQVINSDRRALPADIRTALQDLLPRAYYSQSEIQMVAQEAGVSIWYVNFQQAAVYIWREMIQVAADEKRLGDLLVAMLRYKPAYGQYLNEILERLGPWSTESHPEANLGPRESQH